LSWAARRDSRVDVPVYEYRCKKCGKEFEYEQRMSDAPRKKCEACSGALERLISRTSFQLKGSGWYKDLYSSSKPGDGGGESASAEAPAADPTPAAKTETKDKPAEVKTAAKADKQPAAKAAPAKKPAKASSKGK
jgi:putative FmdB family regulatory protein